LPETAAVLAPPPGRRVFLGSENGRPPWLGIDRHLQDGVYDENGKPIRTAPKQSRARKADAANMTALARMDNMGRQVMEVIDEEP
jgi:hypothetical protein